MLAGRELWNINSTAAGGGVAEMLRSWVGLTRGLGVGNGLAAPSPADPDFFILTSGSTTSCTASRWRGGGLGEAERRHARAFARDDIEDHDPRLVPRDVVFLHRSADRRSHSEHQKADTRESRCL